MFSKLCSSKLKFSIAIYQGLNFIESSPPSISRSITTIAGGITPDVACTTIPKNSVTSWNWDWKVGVIVCVIVIGGIGYFIFKGIFRLLYYHNT